MFGSLKFWLPQNLPFQIKSCTTGGAGKIELMLLIPDVMVISMLKILNSIPMEFIECLKENA